MTRSRGHGRRCSGGRVHRLRGGRLAAIQGLGKRANDPGKPCPTLLHRALRAPELGDVVAGIHRDEGRGRCVPDNSVLGAPVATPAGRASGSAPRPPGDVDGRRPRRRAWAPCPAPRWPRRAKPDCRPGPRASMVDECFATQRSPRQSTPSGTSSLPSTCRGHETPRPGSSHQRQPPLRHGRVAARNNGWARPRARSADRPRGSGPISSTTPSPAAGGTHPRIRRHRGMLCHPRFRIRSKRKLLPRFRPGRRNRVGARLISLNPAPGTVLDAPPPDPHPRHHSAHRRPSSRDEVACRSRRLAAPRPSTANLRRGPRMSTTLSPAEMEHVGREPGSSGSTESDWPRSRACRAAVDRQNRSSPARARAAVSARAAPARPNVGPAARPTPNQCAAPSRAGLDPRLARSWPRRQCGRRVGGHPFTGCGVKAQRGWRTWDSQPDVPGPASSCGPGPGCNTAGRAATPSRARRGSGGRQSPPPNLRGMAAIVP